MKLGNSVPGRPKRRVKGIWIDIKIWELKIKGMNPTHRCVLAEVDSLSGPNAPCCVGNKYLSEFLGVSVPTISRAISWLHSHGLIRLWYEKNGNTGRRMMPNYSDEVATDPNQIDKGAYQIDKDPYQNDIHRIPLDRVTNLHSVGENPKSKKGKSSAKPKTKRSGTLPRVAAAKSSGSSSSVLFRDSEYADVSVLVNALAGTQYEVADLGYYHEVILNWSNGKGAKKVDWLSVTRNWILRDRRDGKLVYSQTHKTLNNEKSIVDIGQAKRVAGNVRV